MKCAYIQEPTGSFPKAFVLAYILSNKVENLVGYMSKTQKFEKNGVKRYIYFAIKIEIQPVL